jgi:hypothetical protein
MKLSAAILLGSVSTAQGFGVDTAYRNSIDKCVIGAALAAVGCEVDIEGRDMELPYSRIKTLWPWTRERVNAPVDFGPGPLTVVTILWRLNDIVKWTRPQIAAWVASIEPQDAPVTTEQVEHDRTRV